MMVIVTQQRLPSACPKLSDTPANVPRIPPLPPAGLSGPLISYHPTPLLLQSQEPGTLLGYSFTVEAVAAIILSAVLGILVSLSTFLVIGSTSSLSYNIIGHLKVGGTPHIGLSTPPCHWPLLSPPPLT